jgi:small-conductance mechanosensitive channel
MKQQTLYRLGALATLLTALGVTAGNLMYFFGRADTVFYIWYAFVVYFLWVFAYMALFAAQAKQGNLFVFLGFVLLVIGRFSQSSETPNKGWSLLAF